VRASNVPNAAASVQMGHRFIEYNPSFVKNLKQGAKTNWAVYSVLAHEIGHHLQGHTLKRGGSRPSIELEADHYSGFILAKMGASLRNAQKAMRTLGSNSSAGTHPVTAKRLKAIKEGWQKGKKVIVPPPRPPPPDKDKDKKVVVTNYLYRCTINLEEIVIDRTNRVFSRSQPNVQIGQRVPPSHPNCAFNLAAPPTGVYCVGHNGSVYFGTPIPVGQCIQCGPGRC